MNARPINPWRWQDRYGGFSQAVEVTGAERTLYCSGQTSVDEEGRAAHAGDMTAQIHQALDNLETLLKAAGLTLANVVRLSYYTTDVDSFMAAGALGERLEKAGCRAASTLLGVAGLFDPDILVEIEAIAVG